MLPMREKRDNIAGGNGSAGASPSRFENLPERSRPAHGVYRQLNRPTIVFLTVGTKNRRRYLACESVQSLLIEVWQGADAWLVGRYVVMPDHIHLFAGATGSAIAFDNWVRFWKSQFTKRCGLAEHCWRSDHWDRTLRSGNSYEEKWSYVRDNPVRHGLVKVAEEWPFQGELNHLPW